MTTPDEDAQTQIARLKAQLDALMRDRVAPAAEAAAHTMGDAARDAAGTMQDKAEELAAAVRAQPLTALLIAAGIGFLLGRAVR